MPKLVMRPILLVTASMVFALSAGSATHLTVSSAQLATYSRTYGTPATCSLPPVADGHVRTGGADADTNYGTATTLDVRADAGSTSRVLARFDLAACSPAIAPDAIVHSAHLRLTLFASATATRVYEVYRSIETWDETTVTWNTQPTVALDVTSSLTLPSGTSASTVVEWNVLADVQDFVSGAATNHGWRVNDGAEGAAAEQSFASREATSGQPQLVITYAD